MKKKVKKKSKQKEVETKFNSKKAPRTKKQKTDERLDKDKDLIFVLF